MSLVKERPSHVPLQAACKVVGIPRSCYYRYLKPIRTPKVVTKRVAPRKLSLVECNQLISALHSSEFADQPPSEIYAKLLDRGLYLASVRTMYRVLESLNESKERRRQSPPHRYEKPVLVAKRPNEVWTWDITRLSGASKGLHYYLYVVLDLYSRYIVGWMVAERESASLATHFVHETAIRIGIVPGQLTSHSDRGSPMKSESMTQLLASLGIEKSFSRPRVSNDNPYIESHFRTLKYQPDYPERFGSLLHARAWLSEFFDWYNNHHQHEGLAYFTPKNVYDGDVSELAKVRQLSLDEAYKNHPERFVKGPPQVRLPPSKVCINGDDVQPGLVLATHISPLPIKAAQWRSQEQSRAPLAARSAREPLTAPRTPLSTPLGNGLCTDNF